MYSSKRFFISAGVAGPSVTCRACCSSCALTVTLTRPESTSFNAWTKLLSSGTGSSFDLMKASRGSRSSIFSRSMLAWVIGSSRLLRMVEVQAVTMASSWASIWSIICEPAAVPVSTEGRPPLMLKSSFYKLLFLLPFLEFEKYNCLKNILLSIFNLFSCVRFNSVVFSSVRIQELTKGEKKGKQFFTISSLLCHQTESL
ncbi:hypothetical protein DINO107042_06855 [Dichelobacter nodosus]